MFSLRWSKRGTEFAGGIRQNTAPRIALRAAWGMCYRRPFKVTSTEWKQYRIGRIAYCVGADGHDLVVGHTCLCLGVVVVSGSGLDREYVLVLGAASSMASQLILFFIGRCIA